MFRKVLIDLDSILDTRLATIRNINPEAAKHLMKTQDYWKRDFNDWKKLTGGLVTNEMFNEAYEKRGGENTADTLNASIMTGIMSFLIKLISVDEINRIDGMGDPGSEISIEVNKWPYILNFDQEDELLACLHEWYGQEIQISIVSTPIENLTCKVLDTYYAAAIMSDINTWCKTHMYDLANSVMPDFNIIGPKLFELDPSNLTVGEKQEKFKAFRILRLANIDFEFIDAEYFSMFKP